LEKIRKVHGGVPVSNVAVLILRGCAGAVCRSIGFGPASQQPLKCVGKDRVGSVVLARVENHPHLVETVLLSLQELDNRLERNGCGQAQRISERARGKGRKRNAA
jgi:hypothetical protein